MQSSEMLNLTIHYSVPPAEDKLAKQMNIEPTRGHVLYTLLCDVPKTMESSPISHALCSQWAGRPGQDLSDKVRNVRCDGFSPINEMRMFAGPPCGLYFTLTSQACYTTSRV
jgi:hypothetical protein